MALPIFYEYSTTFLKYALHHLSPGGIFLYLATLNYIISLLGCATSQLWNLNHIISFLSGLTSHHVSKIWTMSPSSSIWSWCCIISLLRACPCNVKVLAAFFLKLQGFVGISLQCQSLGGILLETSRFHWHLRNLNEGLLASLTSCWHFWNLDVWAMLPLKIDATSMQVQVLMWSVVMASWQRWTLAWLRRKWSVDVTSWFRHLAFLKSWCLSYVASKNWCNFNASASANVECCRGFMAKMNVGTASTKMKCWRDFMASAQMKC